MRALNTLLILPFALFCQVASATTHFVQVGQGGGNNFAPTFVIINQGDTVQWDWVTGVHSVTSGTPGNPDGIFDSGISGEPNTFSFTFNTPANYPYYCTVHGAMMTGTIYVAVIDPPSPTVGPTATATATPTVTPTATPPATATPTPSATPTPTGTPGVNGKIAFSSARAGRYEIHVMDPDGSHVIRLTDTPVDLQSSSPVWSPDGTKIAFSTNRDSGNWEIYVMNADGSGLTNLTNSPIDEDYPAWSPDGKKIAFTSKRAFSEGLLWEIYVMDADGSNQTRLTNNPAMDRAPAWSPDGTRIAFQTDRDGAHPNDNYEIYLMDVDGGNLLRLTNNSVRDESPAWSPDGSKIAYSSWQPPVIGIFVMNSDGSNQTRLTNTTVDALFPSWSPDGTKIVFTSFASDTDIHVIDANGANEINLTPNSPISDQVPNWQRKPTSTPGQAFNISTRMRVEAGNNVLIGGFIVTGTAPKTVAVRALGPSLGQLGISDTLADPTLDLRGPTGALLQQNDNWQDDPEQANQLTSLGLPLQNPNESGLVATLSPQSYTAIVSGKNAGTGVGLVEVYDINPSPDSQLANISTRGFVSTGSNVMIGGFILGGGNNTHVAVRGIGPSLVQFGLSPLLADPTVELRDSNGALLVSNDNWHDDVVSASHLTAFGLGPQNSAESGIYIGLPPGAFTAILTGKNAGTGIGLVEIYNLGEP